MTTQRTWNVGETVEGEEYKHLPAGVFVARGDGDGWQIKWFARLQDGKILSSNDLIYGIDELAHKRTIIARPADAPTSIPVYIPSLSTEEQIRMLDKIKREAETLIAERDALKQDLRKARDACKRLREELEARKTHATLYDRLAGSPVRPGYRVRMNGEIRTVTDVNGVTLATDNPIALKVGDAITSIAQLDACPIGTIITCGNASAPEKDLSFEKLKMGWFWCGDTVRERGANSALAFPLRGCYKICSLPLQVKPKEAHPAFVPAIGAAPKTREDFAACPVGTQIQFRQEFARWVKLVDGQWVPTNHPGLKTLDEDMVRLFGALERRITDLPPPASTRIVIRKGQKISTPAEYDALSAGSRVRRANGTFWQKAQDGAWYEGPRVLFAGEVMRDKAFPRTVLRIGYDDTACVIDGRVKTAIKVGDVLTTLEQIESAPVGTRMHVNPGFTWERKNGGSWVLDGMHQHATPSENMDPERRWTVTHVPA